MKRVVIHYCPRLTIEATDSYPCGSYVAEADAGGSRAVGGGLGEFRVDIDNRQVLKTNRLLYPTPSKVAQKIKSGVS